MATAVVSEPPRPRNVTFLSVETPWLPPMTGMHPAARASTMRSGRSSSDLGVGVVGVGDEPGLRPGERLGDLAEIGDGHGDQRHRLALAGGDEHVHLAAWLGGGDVVGEAQELVGLLAHGRHDEHDVGATTLGADGVLGDLADPVGVGDGRAAELLDGDHARRRDLRERR